MAFTSSILSVDWNSVCGFNSVSNLVTQDALTSLRSFGKFNKTIWDFWSDSCKIRIPLKVGFGEPFVDLMAVSPAPEGFKEQPATSGPHEGHLW
jgi:hypothetical protein